MRLSQNYNCLLSLFIVVFVMLSGCSGKKETTAISQKTPAKITTTTNNKSLIRDISDNPAFYAAKKIQAQAPAVKNLDSFIRPVLVRLFGAAEIIEESGQRIERDGEVVLNEYSYAVKKLLDRKDIEDLHAALLTAHFSTSPRLGSKPTITNRYGGMSLFKSTNSGSYSLVISIDFSKQVLKVTSYQLGSKYDRLM